MSRTHIHKYQTRYHAQATYSKAIRARGDFVFMQGQVGTLLDGTLVGEGDPGGAGRSGLPQHQALDGRGGRQPEGCLQTDRLCH